MLNPGKALRCSTLLPGRYDLRVTPAQRVKTASAVHGADTVATWCAGLLTGARWQDSPANLGWIADTSAHSDTWLASPVNQYWPRVWAARALLYAWSSDAAPAVIVGLSDDAWRVREMCAKVARLRRLPDAVDRLSDLTTDPVARVRLAAQHALAALGPR